MTTRLMQLIWFVANQNNRFLLWMVCSNGVFMEYLLDNIFSFALVRPQNVLVVFFLSLLKLTSTTISNSFNKWSNATKNSKTMLAKSSSSPSLTLFTYHSRTHNFKLIEIHRAKKKKEKKKTTKQTTKQIQSEMWYYV